jgi:hypothetical protein
MPISGQVLTLTAALLDSWPVGIIYRQWPNTPTPQSLLGGTWTNVSNLYAGLFARVEGGNAAAFNATGVTTQAQDVQPHGHAYSGNTGGMSVNASHTHTQYTAGSDDKNFSSNPGQFPPGDSNAGPYNTGDVFGATNTDHTHAFSGTTANAGSVETRPINTAIRIWQRSA